MSRLSKEKCIGPGGKPSSQKLPYHVVVGLRLGISECWVACPIWSDIVLLSLFKELKEKDFLPHVIVIFRGRLAQLVRASC